MDLPYPPPEFRALVGPTELEAYDNPEKDWVWGALEIPPLEPGECYRRVFDFGCGCGREARQLLQQVQPPIHYIGVDVHRGMIDWCNRNLVGRDCRMEFRHHDVHHPTYAPQGKRRRRSLSRYGRDFTLINVHSVFTHLLEEEVRYYLAQMATMLSERGLIRSSWYLFDRSCFPMLAEHQNSLYVSAEDPTQAVFYDWELVRRLVLSAGLKIVTVSWPERRGFQAFLFLARGSAFEDLSAKLEPDANVLGFQGRSSCRATIRDKETSS